MYITRQLWNFRIADTKTHRFTHGKSVGLSVWALSALFTLAVAAVAAEVAAAGVLELAVAFGADANHVGHDGAGDGFLGVMLLARDGASGVG